MKMRFLTLPLLVALAASCRTPQEDIPGGKCFSFTHPVISVSKVEECLYLGTESGGIIRFRPDDPDATEFYKTVYGRVYGVTGYGGDTVLAGIRDAGLQMLVLSGGRTECVGIFRIGKGSNYSPYKSIVCRGEGTDTVWCGTSNGLFRALVPKDAPAGTVMEPIVPQQEDNGYKFFLLERFRGKIYAAGDKGLYRIGPDARAQRILEVPVSSLCNDGDSVLVAAGCDGRLYDAVTGEVTDMSDAAVFYRSGGLQWELRADGGSVRDLRGNCLDFKGKIPVGDDMPRNRSCILEGDGYTYLIYDGALRAVPHTMFSRNDAELVCFAEDDACAYGVSDDNLLYRFDFRKGRSHFVKRLATEEDRSITRLLTVRNGLVYYATDVSIESCGAGRHDNERHVLHRSARGSYVNVNLLEDGFAACCYDCVETCSFDGDTARIQAPEDFYSTVAEQTGDGRLLVGTLDGGLYLSGEEGRMPEKAASCAQVLDICRIGKHVYVLDPEELVMFSLEGKTLSRERSMKVRRGTSGIVSGNNCIYMVSDAGGIDCLTMFLDPICRLHSGRQFGKGDIEHRDGVTLLRSDAGVLMTPSGDLDGKWTETVRPGRLRIMTAGKEYFLGLAAIVICAASVLLGRRAYVRVHEKKRTVRSRRMRCARAEQAIMEVWRLDDAADPGEAAPLAETARLLEEIAPDDSRASEFNRNYIQFRMKSADLRESITARNRTLLSGILDDAAPEIVRFTCYRYVTDRITDMTCLIGRREIGKIQSLTGQLKEAARISGRLKETVRSAGALPECISRMVSDISDAIARAEKASPEQWPEAFRALSSMIDIKMAVNLSDTVTDGIRAEAGHSTPVARILARADRMARESGDFFTVILIAATVWNGIEGMKALSGLDAMLSALSGNAEREEIAEADAAAKKKFYSKYGRGIRDSLYAALRLSGISKYNNKYTNTAKLMLMLLCNADKTVICLVNDEVPETLNSARGKLKSGLEKRMSAERELTLESIIEDIVYTELQ